MPVLQIASAFYVYPGSLLLTFFLDEKIIEKELQREKKLYFVVIVSKIILLIIYVIFRCMVVT